MLKWKKILLQAVKIAIGSSAAIWLAETLGLNYSASAGTITLLTLMTTKWETVKLSLFRLVTFAIAIVVAGSVFLHMESTWLAYGIFIFVMSVISYTCGWKATLSVNAVTGTHLITTHDFSLVSVKNEFILVLIGISLALILNLFHDNHNHRKDMIANMRYVEKCMQTILEEMAKYLSNIPVQFDIWQNIRELEQKLQEYVREAYEYQDNTFYSHPEYYINYFNMRCDQCQVLYNLHYEMKKIQSLPEQSKIVADYIQYLADYVQEHNVPSAQIDRLKQMFINARWEELPKTRGEFEGRAMLYHILMDLEDFLMYKQKFIEGLDERQIKVYWES